MPTTPVQALPYPALSDPANGPIAVQNLALALEDYKTLVRCTSSTRPAHVEGRVIYETDTDTLLVSTGTSWRSISSQWTNFGISTPNIPCTVLQAKYLRVGDTVTIRAQIQLTANLIGPALIDPPFPFASDTQFTEWNIVGRVRALRSGVAFHQADICPIVYASVNRFGIYQSTGSGVIYTVSSPAAWASGDKFGIDLTYQAAPA